MPIPITDNWKMITRPVITWAAAPVPNSIDASGEANFDTEYGLVNAQLPFLFSPKSQSAFAWGLGPTFQTPNNTNSKLDDDNWEAGIGNVLIYKPTNWTIGMETQYWWSFEEDGDDEETVMMKRRSMRSLISLSGMTLAVGARSVMHPQ
jgi:hypothetical protein